MGVLLGAAACGTTTVGPPPSTPRIDFIDGAIEPVLTRGEPAVVEGFGFGDSQATGSVRFSSAAGSTPAPVAGDGWNDRFIQVIVPDSATTGTVTVTTARGLTLTATVHVLPRVPFDPAGLRWQGRTTFPGASVGVAMTAETRPVSGGLQVVVYAVGGAKSLPGDSTMAPDSGVFVTSVAAGGGIGAWSRPRDLPEPRAFAAATIANRFNSRLDATALYVIGGADSTGRARATVFRSIVAGDSGLGAFTTIEPLPTPVAGAIAVVHRGSVYVMGGTDSLGTPQASVFVGRIRSDGHIDGWYAQPALPTPRAYGGGVVLERRILVFGGIADSAPIGGGLDSVPPRLATADTAHVSPFSGFFTSPWGSAGVLLPDGRSQFAELRLGNVVLLVGGVYRTASSNGAETLAAPVLGDSLGDFSGPVGTNTIAGLGGGTLVGAASVSWRDVDGSYHGLLAGGLDLLTRTPRDGVWGF